MTLKKGTNVVPAAIINGGGATCGRPAMRGVNSEVAR
jgi:hypothetical protein